MTKGEKEQLISSLLNNEECKHDLVSSWINDYAEVLFDFNNYGFNTSNRGFKYLEYEFSQKYLKAVMSLSARKNIYLELLAATKDDAIEKYLGTPDEVADKMYNKYIPAYFEHEKQFWHCPLSKADPLKWVRKSYEENDEEHAFLMILSSILERWKWDRFRNDYGVKLALVKQFAKSSKYNQFRDDVISGKIYEDFDNQGENPAEGGEAGSDEINESVKKLVKECVIETLRRML